ncbi:MAG: class I SAM-dependent methyltransferase [Chlamydiales bacterium]|nr:class I SAM-dependent methyltransferase [Chlamydiia bacterium]MCP5503952.1 class I SAM-dependent methyltransferase [Chlamydiales bacterium]
MSQLDEKSAWNATTELLVKESYKFGPHWSFNFRNDPKRLGFVLSRYKFSSKILGRRSHILELGCSDGIGTSILAENAKQYTGVDLDKPAVEIAKINFKDHTFIHDDFMGNTYGTFDGVVSLDVVEHILPEYEDLYFETVVKNLSDKGIAVIGTPNITASPYASKASELGHVNLFSQQRLINKLKESFHNVFPFGINDEIVHTGYSPMAHYLICVACHKK